MNREPGWIARKDRIAVDLNAVVTRPDGSRSQVRVINLSEEGCRVESDEQLWIGEYVILETADGDRRRDKVHWALLDKARLRFVNC